MGLPQHTSCKHSDLHFLQADYRQPYVRGTGDPLKTALEGTLFNNRKTSGVFNSGGCLCTAACLANGHAIFHSIADGEKGCLLTQPSAPALHALVVVEWAGRLVSLKYPHSVFHAQDYAP